MQKLHITIDLSVKRRTVVALFATTATVEKELLLAQHLQHTQLQVLFFVRLSKDLKNDCAKWLSQFSISRGY